MKTIAEAGRLAELTARLAAVTETTPRSWGTMSAQQMLLHLGDGAEAVLKRRPFTVPARAGNRVLKWVALVLPLPWPRGLKTGADPAAQEVSPAEFATHRTRAISTLQELAAAPETALADRHPVFGPMSCQEWQRWAFLHVDHHLRQFGL